MIKTSFLKNVESLWLCVFMMGFKEASLFPSSNTATWISWFFSSIGLIVPFSARTLGRRDPLRYETGRAVTSRAYAYKETRVLAYSRGSVDALIWIMRSACHESFLLLFFIFVQITRCPWRVDASLSIFELVALKLFSSGREKMHRFLLLVQIDTDVSIFVIRLRASKRHLKE